LISIVREFLILPDALHFAQGVFMICPLPLQFGQGLTLVNVPKKLLDWVRTWPRPPHWVQVAKSEPPFPLHDEHLSKRLILNFFLAELDISSSDTFSIT
jgi:hypothetical protein